MTCSFDSRYFDPTYFDACADNSSGSILQITYPFILKKSARGFVLNFTFNGTLLRNNEKNIFFTMKLKRRLQKEYSFNGIFLNPILKTSSIFSGTSLIKKEINMELEQSMAPYQELSERVNKERESLEGERQVLKENQEIYNILQDLDSLEQH